MFLHDTLLHVLMLKMTKIEHKTKRDRSMFISNVHILINLQNVRVQYLFLRELISNESME